MKKLFFYIALIFFGYKAYSQQNLFSSKINWGNYEKDFSLEYKKEEIKKIKDDLLEYLEGSEILEENLLNFHFVDYDLNGIIDIVYSGNAGTETKRTLIFELGENNFYSKTFDRFGELINISYENILTPYTLTLREDPCCGGNLVVYEKYCPVNQGGKLELQASSKYCAIVGTDFPATFTIEPILFEVKNELYYLRLTPIIDNESINESINIKGNIIAEYGLGAKGYAVSEKQDETGRVWWFVIMVNNNKPLKTMLDTGSNNENEYYSLGWMSSRYLQEIK